MSNRITSIVPVPRTVTVGGKPYTVRQATLRDVAVLQSWLDTKADDPLPTLLAALEGVGDDEKERDRLLFEALDRTEGSPAAAFGEPDAARLFATPAGLAVFLTVALKFATPGEVAEAYEALTADEYVNLRRVFFGVDSVAAINKLIWGPPPRTTAEEPVTWGQAIDELAVGRGWTYDDVYSLTLTEFKNARRGGRPDPAASGEFRAESFAELAKKQDELCRRRYGMSAAEYFASSGLAGVKDDYEGRAVRSAVTGDEF